MCKQRTEMKQISPSEFVIQQRDKKHSPINCMQYKVKTDPCDKDTGKHRANSKERLQCVLQQLFNVANVLNELEAGFHGDKGVMWKRRTFQEKQCDTGTK